MPGCLLQYGAEARGNGRLAPVVRVLRKVPRLVFLSPWSGQVRRFGAGPPVSRGFPNRASRDRCVMLLGCDDGAWKEGRVLLGSLLLLIMGSKMIP